MVFLDFCLGLLFSFRVDDTPSLLRVFYELNFQPCYLQVDWMRQKFGSFMKDVRPGEVFELPVKTPSLSCKCTMYAQDLAGSHTNRSIGDFDPWYWSSFSYTLFFFDQHVAGGFPGAGCTIRSRGTQSVHIWEDSVVFAQRLSFNRPCYRPTYMCEP